MTSLRVCVGVSSHKGQAAVSVLCEWGATAGSKNCHALCHATVGASDGARVDKVGSLILHDAVFVCVSSHQDVDIELRCTTTMGWHNDQLVHTPHRPVQQLRLS